MRMAKVKPDHNTAGDSSDVRMVGARRSPSQERSQETVQRIFAAASRLLGRGVPLEDVTTGMIAGEAEVSVGALYRFFPDKQAIVDAIAARHLEDFQGLLIQGLMFSPPADGPSLLGAVIDAFVAFLDDRPDFRTIAYGGRYVSSAAREGHSKPEGGLAGMVKGFMVDGLGIESTPELDLRLRIVTEAGDRLLAYALDQPTVEERDRVVGEMKKLLGSYFFAEDDEA
jgi:AcrR family transcriptional regulator